MQSPTSAPNALSLLNLQYFIGPTPCLLHANSHGRVLGLSRGCKIAVTTHRQAVRFRRNRRTDCQIKSLADDPDLAIWRLNAHTTTPSSDLRCGLAVVDSPCSAPHPKAPRTRRTRKSGLPATASYAFCLGKPGSARRGCELLKNLIG